MRATATITGSLVILIILCGAYPAVAKLYQWTNADGVRHFSNTPPPEGVKATIVQDEIPYDPETDNQRRAQEDAMLQERESAKTQERLENAERDAEEARRQAEAAKRKADRLEKELEEQEDDRSYGVYYPRRRPGHRPPGYRPPGHRPPGYRPPDHRPPGQRPPVWRPKPEPYSDAPKKPGQRQPRRQPRKSSPQSRPQK